MSSTVRDYTPLLREAIAEARAAGFETAATELERAAFFTAFTTSSETLLEHALAIQRFLKASRASLTASRDARTVAAVARVPLD